MFQTSRNTTQLQNTCCGSVCSRVLKEHEYVRYLHNMRLNMWSNTTSNNPAKWWQMINSPQKPLFSARFFFWIFVICNVIVAFETTLLKMADRILRDILVLKELTHWGRDKMAAISQTTFSKAFLWMKMYKFRLRFHRGLFPRVQLTISQHRFR